MKQWVCRRGKMGGSGKRGRKGGYGCDIMYERRKNKLIKKLKKCTKKIKINSYPVKQLIVILEYSGKMYLGLVSVLKLTKH